MILLIIAMGMAFGLTFATFYSINREHKASLFNSMKMSQRYQFTE